MESGAQYGKGSGNGNEGDSRPDGEAWAEIADLDFTAASPEAAGTSDTAEIGADEASRRRVSDVYRYPDAHAHEGSDDSWAGQPNAL